MATHIVWIINMDLLCLPLRTNTDHHHQPCITHPIMTIVINNYEPLLGIKHYTSVLSIKLCTNFVASFKWSFRGGSLYCNEIQISGHRAVQCRLGHRVGQHSASPRLSIRSACRQTKPPGRTMGPTTAGPAPTSYILPVISSPSHW